MTTVAAARRTWLIVAGAGFVVVAVCTFLVRDGALSDFEVDVFRVFNDLPDALEAPMTWVQYLGVAVIPFVLAAIAAVLRKWYLVVAALLVYPLKLFVEKVIIKELVYRGRPGATLDEVNLRHASATGPSFPSGHAIIAFAVAGILAPYLSRGWRIVAYGVAVAVCVSRMYLGAHHPLDVVAGAAGGLVIAAGLNLALAPSFGWVSQHTAKAGGRAR
jgi:undecaprenyl-diphosphatase